LQITEQRVNTYLAIICAIGALLAGIDFFQRRANASSGTDRLYALLIIGLIAAGIHGVLWTYAEKYFGLHSGAGGHTTLPRGWEAVVLALTMTLPLMFVPPLYGFVTTSQIVSPGHYTAAFAVVITAAFGHLLLYGTKALPFQGLRNIIFPLDSPLNPWRALCMEAIYGLVHFSTIVFVYQEFSRSLVWPPNIFVVRATLWPALFWFLCISAYILVKYPESLIDKSWIQVRGFLSAALLMVALTGGMLR
jgi:hypothetical protein